MRLTRGFLLGLAVVAAWTAGCGQSGGPLSSTPFDPSRRPLYAKYDFQDPATTIRFGAQPLWAPPALITEALKRDQILKESLAGLGLGLKFYDFLKGSDLNFYLGRGDLDAGVVGDHPAISAAAVNQALVSMLVQQGFISLMAGRPMLLRDLRGQSVGYPPGSAAHYILLQALAREGLAADQVDLIPLDVNEMDEAWRAGRITAYTSWEPNATIAVNKNKMNVVYRAQYAGFLYFSQSFAERRPEALKSLMAAGLRALRWLQDDRKNLLRASRWAVAATERFTGAASPLSADDVAVMALQDVIGVLFEPVIPRRWLEADGALEKRFDFLKSLKLLPPEATWAATGARFDEGIIMEILTRPKKYRLRENNYQD